MNSIQHLAIIMDGNGRWATEQGFSRARGHFAGARNAFNLIRQVRKRHISTLSLFAFSKENWSRPVAEVNTLMKLLAHSIEEKISFFLELGIKLRVIGDRRGLPPAVLESIHAAEDVTAKNQGMNLLVAVNYSGQCDILHAIKQLGLAKKDLTKITPADFQEALFTGNTEPPDLIIRTGGESRLSNFFLWQAAYSEIQFDDKYWPEFRCDDLDRHLARFLSTERRFGQTSAQLEKPRFGPLAE